MNNRTALVIEAMDAYKGQVMAKEEWVALLNNRISFDTFKKYALVKEAVPKVVKREASLEELVAMLNDCAGNDCYGCDWHYVVEDGKAYEVEYFDCYKMI